MTSAFEMDSLQLYLGEQYVINDNIIIKQPKIGELANYGERDYYSMVHTLTAIPSSMKSQLRNMELLSINDLK